jgi:hypothetical protein
MLIQKADDFYKKAFQNNTFLHPAAGTVLAMLAALMFILPRRLALLPFLALICFIPASQRVAIAGLDFNLMRILLIFGWLRILSRGEHKVVKWLLLDKLVLAWGIVQTIAYVALFRNSASAIYMSGKLMEAWGGYFLVRVMVRDWEDVFTLARGAAMMAIPVAVFFIIEKNTGTNYFAVFGGLEWETVVRSGKLRAAGALGNPILAGCFWASFIPMMGALWWSKGGKFLAIAGVASAMIVVIACASSTPIAAVGAAGLGAVAFRWRYKAKQILKALCWTALAMQLVMSQPIYHLILRIDLVGGSTGEHRFRLIDAFIRWHWREWVLIGIEGTGHWGFGLNDIANQYVLEGCRGGLAGLAVYIWGIVIVFLYSVKVWKSVEFDRAKLTMAWGLASCVFAHCMAFIAVSYFGQMNFAWFLHIGIIAGLYEKVLAKEALEEDEEGEDAEEEEGPTLERERWLLGAS